jgi:hypothetical protein
MRTAPRGRRFRSGLNAKPGRSRRSDGTVYMDALTYNGNKTMP